MCAAELKYFFIETIPNKRRSRHAAHAAKALRRRVDQLLKCLYKENNSLVKVYFMSRSALGYETPLWKLLPL